MQSRQVKLHRHFVDRGLTFLILHMVCLFACAGFVRVQASCVKGVSCVAKLVRHGAACHLQAEVNGAHCLWEQQQKKQPSTSTNRSVP